jgi:hypothetical protein
MYPKETTSTGWFDAFVRWIGMHGMLKGEPGQPDGHHQRHERRGGKHE